MDKFRKGILFHDVKTLTFEELEREVKPLSMWDGGYFGFSDKDLTLKDFRRAESLFVAGRVATNDLGVSGYLQEIGLWRKIDGGYEEIYAERQDANFFFERWILKEKDEERNGLACYYRWAEVSTLPHSVLRGERIRAIEVIVPDYRLNIFITVSERRDESK